jgi:hypothetical protein
MYSLMATPLPADRRQGSQSCDLDVALFLGRRRVYGRLSLLFTFREARSRILRI